MSATLKDVAKASGVSIRSVRRALKGMSGVSEETCARVRAVAKELDYVPNIAARNLRLQTSSFVGIIYSANSADAYKRRLYDLIARLNGAGYEPLLSSPPKSFSEVEELVRRWSGITNVIIWMNPAVAILPALAAFQQRFILIEEEFQASNCCCISVDRSIGVAEAVRSLLKAGHRKIVRCGNIPTREAGFLRPFSEPDTPSGAKALFIPSKSSDYEDGYQAGARIMASGADAVFFDVDRMAMGFLRYAHEQKIPVPERIAVVGFDDDNTSVSAAPPLSSVGHPIRRINEKIVELIRNGVPGNTTIAFETMFFLRESSGK